MMNVSRPRFRPGALVLACVLLSAALLLAGCGGEPADAAEELTPPASATPWPTLAPVAPTGTVSPTADAPGDVTPTPAASGPELIDQFRSAISSSAIAVFPLPGEVEHPVRVEVIVLSGELNPVVLVSNLDGDRLAEANSGGLGEPEVIGQFIFPADGYYELGITTAEGEGEVGVSVYRLDSADLEGGGTFEAPEQTLRGRVEHPSTYHTFRLPAERGQRFDLGAEALTEGLDLLFELYDPSGLMVAARDDNVDKDPWLWNFMPAQSGVYTLVLSNYGETTGEYAVHLAPSEGGGEAVLGTRTEISLQGSPRRSTWLTFDANALDAVRVEVRPIDAGVDPSVAIYDAVGNALVEANLAGAGQAEELTLVQFPRDGRYQLELSTLNESGAVEYYIRYYKFVELEDVGEMVVPGGFGKSGEFEGPGTVMTYLFDANAGDVVGVDAHATGNSTVDLAFDLYAPDGTRLARRDDVVGKNPIIDGIELPQAGRYALALWNYADTTGEFDVFVTNPGALATPPGESLDLGGDAGE